MLRVGADRAVERSPIMQRIRQDTNLREPFVFPADNQRYETDRPAIAADNKHPQSLVITVVRPVGFEPVERMEKRGIVSLAQQRALMLRVRIERIDIVDLEDLVGSLHHGVSA